MPQTRARSHKSKLYHEKMVREILLQEINDLPMLVDYNFYRKNSIEHGQKPMSIKRYRKEW